MGNYVYVTICICCTEHALLNPLFLLTVLLQRILIFTSSLYNLLQTKNKTNTFSLVLVSFPFLFLNK